MFNDIDVARAFREVDAAYSSLSGLRAPVREMDTRLIPIDRIECSYARNRVSSERTPVPAVGDPVYYRHNEWDSEVDVAVVREVQNLQQYDDPNLWQIQRDQNNRPVADGFGGVLMVPVNDPWPWIVLRSERYGLRRTWESRVRGSAGWLPLNWRTRPVWLAGDLIARGLG